MKSTWKRIWDVLRSILGWWILGIIILVTVLYLYTLTWTGLGDYTTPTGDFVRGKTLWDWMELLIIPLVLAIGAFALNRSERALERRIADNRVKLEREIAADRQQEAALQAYIDRMSELLLEKKLRTTKKAEVRDVARTRTISVMRGLDTRRNDLVLQFLREAKLVTDGNSIFNEADMEGMNLQGLNFQTIFLQKTNLKKTNLEGANLSSTNLKEASLEEANLKGANLSRAYLEKAKLTEAELAGADLRVTNLVNADLSFTNLKEVWLTMANLANANFEGADLTNAWFIGSNLNGAFFGGEALLNGAILEKTNLEGAYFNGAYLEGADLNGANLKGADLGGTHLKGAILTNAKVTKEQLAQVASLKGATMPDGTIHE